MSESLKINPNGQWVLEKNWTSSHKKKAGDWAESGLRQHLEKLPKAKGALRDKMLSHMTKEATHRVNPDTGKREFRLSRATTVGDKFHEKNTSSWTAHPDFAYYWTHVNSYEDKNDPTWKKPNFQVMHAWVPEEHIHSYLPTVLKPMGHEKAGEGEALVSPHKLNLDAVHSGKILDKHVKRITSAPMASDE